MPDPVRVTWFYFFLLKRRSKSGLIAFQSVTVGAIKPGVGPAVGFIKRSVSERFLL